MNIQHCPAHTLNINARVAQWFLWISINPTDQQVLFKQHHKLTQEHPDICIRAQYSAVGSSDFSQGRLLGEYDAPLDHFMTTNRTMPLLEIPAN